MDKIDDYLVIKDYWYAFVSALLGCLGGIGWSELKYKRVQARQDTANKTALIDALEKTKRRAEELSQAWGANGQPSPPIEVQRISTLLDRVSQFNDTDVRGEMEGLVYECLHYNAKLLVINSAYLTALAHTSHTVMLEPYRKMMSEHLSKIVGWATTPIEKLKREV